MPEETITPQSTGAATSATTPPDGQHCLCVDLEWVWREVRKRVFIKLPFSLGVADAMEAIKPITLTEDTLVCGLEPKDYPLAAHLHAVQVRNTIENILYQAAKRHINFEVIEGTTLKDWEIILERQQQAHSAVTAVAEKRLAEHHYDDVLNQIVSDMRRRITGTQDRTLPQVRAHLMLDIVPELADLENMLCSKESDTHDRRRSIARTIDRIASFLEVPAFTLALEIERHRLYGYKLRENLQPKPKVEDPAATPHPPVPGQFSTEPQPSPAVESSSS